MAANVLNIWGEVIGVFGGALILLIFGITFSPLVRHPSKPAGAAARKLEPGEKEAHLEEGEAKGGEVVRADGFIDSFAGLVEEGGGSLPLIVTIFTIGLLVWWLLYLILNWSQYLFSIRTLLM